MKTEDVFSPFGILKNKLEQYSYREDQEKMAALVEEAFERGLPVVVEAGTGIGKSFAYLVPSFLLLERNPDSKVVVATSTIPLQKQLFDKDIPFLEKALNKDINVAILYGRGNYICARKYKDFISSLSLIALDPTSSEARLKEWVETTETGSRSDISDGGVARVVKDLLSDEDDCLGRTCPFFEDCFFYKARRDAQKADLIITNHHIVLADSQIRWENNEDFSEPTILPGYTHLIVDEAHHIEKEATDVFSDKYDKKSVQYFIDSLKRKQSRYANVSILEFLSSYEKDEFKGEGKRISKALDAFSGEIEEYDNLLKGVFSVFVDKKGMLLTKEFYDAYRSRLMIGEALAKEMKNIGERVENLWTSDNEEINQFIDRGKKYGIGLQYLSDVLRSFIRFSDWDNGIPYAEEDSEGSPTIKIAPMSVGPILHERLVKNLSSILYCSATLSVGGNFNYFAERSGLKEEKEVLSGVYYSPFDFKKQLMYLIPQDSMDWKNNDPGYVEYASKMIASSILSSGGGALVLFTSIKMMNEVYERVNKEIGKECEILIQNPKTSRNILLSKFKKNEDSSLFATSSFWEGIDAPGNTLRLVIIVKLPFEVPSDPIILARSKYIDSHSDKGSFMTLTVPNAVIKMKQGVGRLIRNEEDKGIVMILDGRIIRKGYRHMMFSSLPQGYIPEDTLCENVPGKIERFLF